MSLSATKLTYKGAIKTAAPRTCELYTSASDWVGAQTLKMVDASGTTLYAGLDPANLIKHRDMLPSGASDPLMLKCSPGYDNVFPNGNFASALSGWTAYSPLGTGFGITRVTDSQMLYPPASGLLTKAKTKQTGAYVECAFTIAAADRSSRLYAQVSTKVLEDYVDGLFSVQVLASGKVMAEKEVPNYHTTLQLEWTGNATATYTLRFKVNLDNDSNRTTDKVRKVVLGNIYAGPRLLYTAARKRLITLNDPAEVLADRTTIDDIGINEQWLSYIRILGSYRPYVLYEKTLNFDYDAVLAPFTHNGGSTSPAVNMNLCVGIAEDNDSGQIWIDDVEQLSMASQIQGQNFILATFYWARLSGKHTVRIQGGDKRGGVILYAMLQREIG